MGVTSILLIAVGATLHLAPELDPATGVDFGRVGLILIGVGVLGLVLSLTGAAMARRRRRRQVIVERGWS